MPLSSLGTVKRSLLGPRETTSSALATSMPTNRGEALIVRPPVRRVSRPCPALQDAGWLPGQLYGLVNEKRMAPQLTHGLKGHRQIELPPAVIRLHGARGGNSFQDTRQTYAGINYILIPIIIWEW